MTAGFMVFCALELEFIQMHFFLLPIVLVPLTEMGFLVIGN